MATNFNPRSLRKASTPCMITRGLPWLFQSTKPTQGFDNASNPPYYGVLPFQSTKPTQGFDLFLDHLSA